MQEEGLLSPPSSPELLAPGSLQEDGLCPFSGLAGGVEQGKGECAQPSVKDQEEDSAEPLVASLGNRLAASSKDLLAINEAFGSGNFFTPERTSCFSRDHIGSIDQKSARGISR